MNVEELGHRAIAKRPDLFEGQGPLHVGRQLKKYFPEEFADVIDIDAPTSVSLPTRASLRQPPKRDPALLQPLPSPQVVDQQATTNAEGFVQGVKVGARAAATGPSRAMLGDSIGRPRAAEPQRQDRPGLRGIAEAPGDTAKAIVQQLFTPGGIRGSFDEGHRALNKSAATLGDRMEDFGNALPPVRELFRNLHGLPARPSAPAPKGGKVVDAGDGTTFQMRPGRSLARPGGRKESPDSFERIGPPEPSQNVARRLGAALSPAPPARDAKGNKLGATKRSVIDALGDAVEGAGGLSAAAIGPGLLGGSAAAVGRGGLKGLAKFGAVAGSAVAADPIITEGTKDALEAMGVSPSKARLAGELAGFVVEPAGIVAGVKLAGSKAKAAAKAAAKATKAQPKADAEPPVKLRTPEPVTREAPDIEAKRKDFRQRVAAIQREPVPPRTREQRRAKLGESLGRADPIPTDPLPSNLEPFAKELGLDPDKATRAERQVLGDLYRERQAEQARAAEQPRRDFEAAQQRAERRARNEKARQGIAEIDRRRAEREAVTLAKPEPAAATAKVKPPAKPKRVTLAKPAEPVRKATLTPLLDAAESAEQTAKTVQSTDGRDTQPPGLQVGARRTARGAAKPAPGGVATGPTLARPDPVAAVAPAGVRPVAADSPGQPPQPVAAPARAAARSKATSGTIEIETEFGLIEADELVTSMRGKGDMSPNPAFDSELQPRSLDPKDTEARVSQIVANLDSSRLLDSAEVQSGAPVRALESNEVESGNARVDAIRRIYDNFPEKAAAYRNALIENADRLGIDPEKVRSMRKPVLDRRRITPLSREQRLAFVREANVSVTNAMAAGDTARLDTDRLDSSALGRLVGEKPLSSPDNAEFVRAFVEKVPPTERGAMFAGGKLTGAGLRRVEDALFAKAYGATPHVERIINGVEDSFRNLASAMRTAAPRFAALRSKIAAGERWDLDITESLAESAATMERLRREGMTVDQFVNQQGRLPGLQAARELTIDDHVLLALSQHKQAPSRMARMLDSYADMIDAAGDPRQGDMFGTPEPPNTAELWQAARRKTELEWVGQELSGLEKKVAAAIEREGVALEGQLARDPLTAAERRKASRLRDFRDALESGRPIDEATRKFEDAREADAAPLLAPEKADASAPGDGPQAARTSPDTGRAESGRQAEVPLAPAEPGPAAPARGRREAAAGDAPPLGLKPTLGRAEPPAFTPPTAQPGGLTSLATGPATEAKANRKAKARRGGLEVVASGLKGADVGGLRFTARLYDGSSVTLTRASLEDAKLDAQRIATQRNRPVHLRDRDNNLVEIFYPPPRPPRGLRPENAPRRGAIQFRTVGRENAAIVRPGPTPPPAKKPQRQQIAGRIRAAAQAMAAKVQAAMAELGPATLEARTQLIDSTAPIQDFMAAARAKGIPDNVDAGILARTYAGIYGRAENRIDYLDELIAPARRDADELFESMIYERFDELARRGVKKFPGGQTPLEVNAENARLKRQLAANPAKAKRIRDASGNIRSFTGQMLRELRDEGIISDESYRNSRANNRQYIPLQRVGFLADEIDTPGGPRGFSVASQDVVQSIVGSNRELLNPLESIVGNVYKATSLIGRNRVARAVAGLSKDPDYAGLVVPLKKGQEVPRGMEAIRYFENGKVKSFAVPKVVGDSLKGLQKEHADIVTKVAALSSKGLRAGATQYSVPFILPAAYRDFQQMQATLQIGPVEAGRVWMKGFAEVMGHGAYYRDWLEYGGSFSGRFQVLNFKQRTAKQLLQSKSSRIFWKAINPIGLIAKTNEIIDQSARVGTYRRERTKLGHGPDRAALKSRDVTVDFFRVGTKMRVANLWTPFLNARLQGNLNIYKAFRAHPGKTLLAMGPTVMVPAITTYFWNNLQFGDVLDDIESWEKENSFILIYGREKDSRGRYTQAVKIPKGDIGQVLGTSIENSLDYLRGRDYIAWHALGLQLLSNVSPIPFERDGKVSGGRSVSSVVPPLPKGMLEVTANYDYYRDRAIVSRSLADAPPEEQYYADTPAAAIHIGRFLGVAPAKVHHMFRAQFASVGDQGLRLLGGESPGIGRSVSRRFSGVSGGAIDERNFGELEDSKAQVAAVRVRAQRDAIRILEAAQAKPPGERVGHLRAEMAKIAAVDRDHAVMVHTQMDNEAEKRTMTPYERSLKGAPVKVRADVILARLREMTPEQRGEYVRSMGAKGILSEAVDAELTQRARARTAPGPAN